MATNVEKDSVTGQYTTGHEWDGIKELNTPLPRWWVYVFYATVVWAVGYWVIYPAWPSLGDYTKGVMGYNSRDEHAADMAALKGQRAAWSGRIEAASVDEIAADSELLRYAMAGGKFMFAENCAPCHGSGGAGAFGYPALVDDEWIWGGTLADIEQTIRFGVRNAHAESRQSEMPRFGKDEILDGAAIGNVADYVLSLSGPAGDAAAVEAGKAVFAEQCSACHGENGEGQPAVGGPPLNNQIWLLKGGREGVVAQVTEPRHGTMPAWSGRLDNATIKQLTVYVHALGGGQ